MTTTTATRRRSAPLRVQRLRDCVLCGESFASIRPSHRHCSAECRAEAHHLARILAGRGRRYQSLAERLAAATAPDGAASRLLAAAERRTFERARAIDAGEITGPQRAGLIRWAA